jgi:outer membrane protein TolC/preprotein translocase subunit SecF
VSISALIVVLGMVVDDAIVIADNYVELLDRKVPGDEAAWRSASELAVPVLTATLTIIGSFLPLLMLSGAIGEFIRALPIAVAIALLSSYVVAMLLTPLLARFFIKKGLHSHEAAEPKSRSSPLDMMQRAYSAAIRWALRRRMLVMAGAVAAVVGGVFLLRLAPEQFFPSAERNQFVADIWLPEGTKVEATDQAATQLEQVLRREPQTERYATFVGSSAPRFYYNVNPQAPAANYAQVLVNTKSAEETPRIVDALRGELSHIAPEARFYVKLLQQGKLIEAPIEVRIVGSDIRGLRESSVRVQEILRSIPGAMYVHDDYREDAYDLKVDVRQEVANRLGIANASVAMQLAGGFEGAPVTTYWEGDRDVPVVLRLDPERRNSFGDVAETYVMSLLTGARVPLGSIATLSPEWRPARIVRRNGIRTLTVRAFPDSTHLASGIVKAARPRIDALPLPRGYRLDYGGELESQRETFREMVHALGISLIAIFLILLFQFRSVTDPIIIMMSIPLALPGAALGLLITRNPFGFTAFMGVVSLGGIVVRNAIILIDYMRDRMEHGAQLEEAAREAGERRLRPIFLTTMAAAVGVTPMILSGSSLWSPLASVIAFGLLVSMFFTLIAIPVLYIMVHEKRPRVPAPALAALVALFAAGAIGAETRTITLEEAVALATRNNSNVKLAKLKVRESEAKIGGAAALYYPQISNETAGIHIAEKQSIEIQRGALGVYPSAGPIPGAGISIPLGDQNLLLSTTTITQPLTQIFKIRAGTRVASREADIAKEDARFAENEVALKVKEIYYGLLIARERRRALALQIEAGEEKLKEGRVAVEAGVTLQVKVLEGEARLAQARQALLSLDDSISDYELEFNDLVGLPLETEAALTAPSPESAAALDTDHLLKDALSRHPEILRARSTIEKAKAGLTAARAEYIPDLGAFAQHIYQNGVPLLARNNAAVGFRLNVTLFEFGKRRSVVREREAQVAQAEENLRRVESRVRIDLEKAGRRLRRSAAAVEAAQAALAARREATRITGDEVQAKTATTAALRESEASLAAAQADLYQAELGRGTAAAELTRSAGSR